MRSSWATRVLLPAAQVLAEGSWLAVAYAALQALSGQPAWMGPLELGAAAWAGMAWGRRTSWRSPTAEALGLPLLALAAGMLGWLIDPGVRQALLAGNLLTAVSMHLPGWVAGIAFWRGELHRSAEDDDAIQDRLLRWAVPGLAIPWAAGHLAASGTLEQEFVAAAFIGTVFFVASAFIAMGLARLEAVRASTGSDWRANRSWVGLVLVIAIGVTLVSIPAAALLDVPSRALMVALFGPFQALLFVVLLLATPIVVLAATVAEALGPFLPEGFGIGELTLPNLATDGRQVVNAFPVVIFYVVVGIILLLELAIVALIVWMRMQERRKMRIVLPDPFEERSIVLPDAQQPATPAAARRRPRRPPADDVSEAYLGALEALRRDGRWARRPQETPAGHAARVHAAATGLPGLGRLAAAYQLVRYGGRALPPAERSRAQPRLRALRRFLRG
ncbi:MAG TPA: DUF4129 domain-containing protein [Candidatus Limnocylindrales bacterium]|nr:DUF4129 domain-containing protein [Candidatus Limnocylindrales bacterium]